MVSELPGWLAYEDQLVASAVRPQAQTVMAEPDYSNGIGSEGCGWDAYPELVHVGQVAHEAVEDALSA